MCELYHGMMDAVRQHQNPGGGNSGGGYAAPVPRAPAPAPAMPAAPGALGSLFQGGASPPPDFRKTDAATVRAGTGSARTFQPAASSAKVIG
jgi:hypothetical protein